MFEGEKRGGKRGGGGKLISVCKNNTVLSISAGEELWQRPKISSGREI